VHGPSSLSSDIELEPIAANHFNMAQLQIQAGDVGRCLENYKKAKAKEPGRREDDIEAWLKEMGKVY
jgi:hypothetical protein